MPVLAESPPIQLSGGVPTNTPPPTPTSTPNPGTPRPPRTPKPSTPRPSTPGSNTGTGFAARHQEFVTRLEQIGTCFKRTDIPEFNDTEFQEHSQVAIQDKYLTQDQDRFCSRLAVGNLIEALKRTINEKD